MSGSNVSGLLSKILILKFETHVSWEQKSVSFPPRCQLLAAHLRVFEGDIRLFNFLIMPRIYPSKFAGIGVYAKAVHVTALSK